MYSAIWAYPWDIIDEGADVVVGRVAEAGLNGISMASAYHTIRALCPHNPKRAVYHGEGGVVYFRPNTNLFTGLKIQPQESALGANTDPLMDLCEAGTKQNIKIHAWTVLHHNTRLGTMHPDCSVENAFGDLYPFALCPANPHVRAYSTALVKSLSLYSAVDTIELESLGYMGIDHTGHHSKAGIELDPLHKFLLSICFCPHCCEKMEAHGVNTHAARIGVVQEMQSFFNGIFRLSDDPVESFMDVLGTENAEGILAAREEIVLTLLEELYWLIKKPQKLSVMVTSTPLATGAAAWVTLSQVRGWTDRLLHQAFSKDPGEIHKELSDLAVRRGSTPVHAGLQAMAPFILTRQDLVDRVQLVFEAGAEGVQFYHYGLMPLETLTWIREAIYSLG